MLRCDIAQARGFAASSDTNLSPTTATSINQIEIAHTYAAESGV